MFFLAFRSLIYYHRVSLMLLLGIALAAAVFCGSLFVGDSVRATLKKQGDDRLGKVDSALLGGDRFFTTELVRDIGAPVVLSQAVVRRQDGGAQANQVQIIGVSSQFWKLGPDRFAPDESDFFAVNDSLARQLDVGVGDRILARMPKPSAISKDAPLSGKADGTEAMSGKITHVLSPSKFGNFSLQASPTAPLNLFVPIEKLQDELEVAGRANLALFGFGANVRPDSLPWKLADLSLQLRDHPAGNQSEIFTDRVFLGRELEAAISKIQPDAEGALSYLVNDLSTDATPGQRRVPYSIVAAVAPRVIAELAPVLAEPTRDDVNGSIIVTDWLARSDTGGLGIKVGDLVTVRYFRVGTGRKLVEHEAKFEVGAIVSMDHPLVNPSWMPDFPGVSEADNCSEWEPGFEMDLDRLRPEDEAYWDAYKGTPKAFIPLSVGREVWGTERFGELTSVRLPRVDPGAFELQLRENLSLQDAGIQSIPVRKLAQMAVTESLDFGALFASLSFFLIGSALLLTAMLVGFSVDQRSSQIGTLLAVGFRKQAIRRWFVIEFGILAVLGVLLGCLGGVGFTKAILSALNAGWSGAAAGVRVEFAASTTSVFVAGGSTLLLALASALLSLRLIGKAQPRQLLSGQKFDSFAENGADSEHEIKGRAQWLSPSLQAIVAGLVIAVLCFALTPGLQGESLAGAFLGGAFGILCAGLGALSWGLRKLSRKQDPATGLGSLALRIAGRSGSRSLTVAGVMSAGVFLIIAVNAFRLGPPEDPDRRDSGTGGYSHFATTSAPIFDDLNEPKARAKFNLDQFSLEELKIVPMRILDDGEEASCLNLNAAQLPRLASVNPVEFADRQAFSFAAVAGEVADFSPWDLLAQTLPNGAIPAVADKASAQWALKLGLGGTIQYTDGQGRPFQVQLVGLLNHSILQGSVLISEANFVRKFPDQSGYRQFLIEAKSKDTVEEMTRQLGDFGFAATAAPDRLAAYSQVQNTYIAIFSALGGFGVLLGTLGVAMVIGRNVAARRGELALMQAVGFSRKKIVQFVMMEHAGLLLSGVFLGAVSALLAIVPQSARLGELPWALLGGMVAGILGASGLACWAASRAFTSGNLLTGLRSE